MAITLPTSPSNGDTLTVGAVDYVYNGTKGVWDAPAATGGGGTGSVFEVTNASAIDRSWQSDVTNYPSDNGNVTLVDHTSTPSNTYKTLTYSAPLSDGANNLVQSNTAVFHNTTLMNMSGSSLGTVYWNPLIHITDPTPTRDTYDSDFTIEQGVWNTNGMSNPARFCEMTVKGRFKAPWFAAGEEFDYHLDISRTDTAYTFKQL